MLAPPRAAAAAAAVAVAAMAAVAVAMVAAEMGGRRGWRRIRGLPDSPRRGRNVGGYLGALVGRCVVGAEHEFAEIAAVPAREPTAEAQHVTVEEQHLALVLA